MSGNEDRLGGAGKTPFGTDRLTLISRLFPNVTTGNGTLRTLLYSRGVR